MAEDLEIRIIEELQRMQAEGLVTIQFDPLRGEHVVDLTEAGRQGRSE